LPWEISFGEKQCWQVGASLEWIDTLMMLQCSNIGSIVSPLSKFRCSAENFTPATAEPNGLSP
jgi:hypothetical protein